MLEYDTELGGTGLEHPWADAVRTSSLCQAESTQHPPHLLSRDGEQIGSIIVSGWLLMKVVNVRLHVKFIKKRFSSLAQSMFPSTV